MSGRRLARMLAGAALAAAATGCGTLISAKPVEIPPAARADWEEATSRLARGRGLAGDAATVEFTAALAAARAAVAAAPADFRLAVLAQDAELALDARAARERFVALPQETAAAKTLAARALLPERSEESRSLLEAACAQDPDFAWARYGLAFVDRKLGRGDAALASAERALRLDPTLVESLRLLAELYEGGGDRAKALGAREQLIEVTGGDLHERHRYAQLLLDADDKSDATAAERELHVILTALGDPPAAQQRRFARDALIDLGTAFARRNRINEAVERWQQALALDPDCLMALYNIGVAQLWQNDDPKAALLAFEAYLSRAESMTGPLPSDQVFNRHFYIPNQVMALRRQLGLPMEPPPAPVDPFAVGAPAAATG